MRRGDQDIEEFQKRRISLNDFVEGAPTHAFSKHVHKFNRELLKSACQVIGCKPVNANQIAEGVLDELNQILNNLAESIEFELLFGPEDKHRQITAITTSTALFKYILSKHLEKYKYSRPEYLKDFYIASDLVCKCFINIFRIKKKPADSAGGDVRHGQEHAGFVAGKPPGHFHCALH